MNDRVFICSRYSGNISFNEDIAYKLCRMAVNENKAPIAPHLLYPRFLREYESDDRELGIQCGLKYLEVCDEVWVYDAYGISSGMAREIEYALDIKKPVIRVLNDKVPTDRSSQQRDMFVHWEIDNRSATMEEAFNPPNSSYVRAKLLGTPYYMKSTIYYADSDRYVSLVCCGDSPLPRIEYSIWKDLINNVNYTFNVIWSCG